jgi:cobyrinic acid a,c-diamide synthase
MGGLIVAAPASGSGKTTVTLGLLRALRRRGIPVRAAKSGPDYIDPRFHEAACGTPCVNLDAWAMGEARLSSLAGGEGLLVIEGAMGLFDGAPPDGRGATGDLARLFGLPVVLVVDAARMAQSVGPLVAGFARHDPGVRIAGVILNRMGSDRHRAMLARAVKAEGLPVLGALPRAESLSHPSRHLGLLQAEERPDLEAFLDRAADLAERHLDLDALLALAAGPSLTPASGPRVRPPAQRIALARDAAFAFAYPHQLADWRAQGAEITTFSPLADDAVPQADLVILPGGYPELHAGRLAAAQTFLRSLRSAAERADIYGECGGYMVLGEMLPTPRATLMQWQASSPSPRPSPSAAFTWATAPSRRPMAPSPAAGPPTSSITPPPCARTACPCSAHGTLKELNCRPWASDTVASRAPSPILSTAPMDRPDPRA